MSQTISGLSRIRTACKRKIRSKPRAEGEAYLRMYLIKKEENRIQRYREALNSSMDHTSEGLFDIATEVEKLRKELASDLQATPANSVEQSSEGRDEKSRSGKRRKPFTFTKKMTLDY